MKTAALLPLSQIPAVNSMTKSGHVVDCCHHRASGNYAAGAGAGAGAASAGGAGAFSTAGAGAAAAGAATPHPPALQPVLQPVLQPPQVLQAPRRDFGAQHAWHEPQLGAAVHAVQLGAGVLHAVQLGAGVLHAVHVLQSLAQWCLGLQ